MMPLFLVRNTGIVLLALQLQVFIIEDFVMVSFLKAYNVRYQNRFSGTSVMLVCWHENRGCTPHPSRHSNKKC